MTGQTLSHYRILEKLGEGGMGVVYKAEDTRLRRIVAIKCLRDSLHGNDDFRARFIREAQAAGVLDHPNICHVYELDMQNGQLFLAMAFVDGFPLSRLRGPAQPTLFQSLRLVIQIGEGLRAAHGKGIVHRDIKAENILISREGDAKITDFGLALIHDRSRLTQPGTIQGTISHMSPEQALSKPTDRRTDIWSLGVVLYQLAEGRLPFRSIDGLSTIAQIVNSEFPPLHSTRGPGRKDLDRILRKALAKNPAERYQHIDDLVVDLRAVRDQLPPEPVGSFASPPADVADDPTMTLLPVTNPPSALPPSEQVWLIVTISILTAAALIGIYAITR
jgi:serine/threonine-protein kinase